MLYRKSENPGGGTAGGVGKSSPGVTSQNTRMMSIVEQNLHREVVSTTMK
jgi:hypothetical protein